MVDFFVTSWYPIENRRWRNRYKNGFSAEPHPMMGVRLPKEVGGHGLLPYSSEQRGTNNVNNKSYINKSTANAIAGSIGIFLFLHTIAKERYGIEGLVFAILAAVLVYVILNPNSRRFLLDRIRKLGKSIRGEE